MRIARDFHWEMGHRLPFHQSGCANIHGHSYRLTVELTGRLDANGMLMDYGEMKRLIMPLIDELDHAFLCDDKDTLMLNFLSGSGLKYKIVPFTSTAENLSLYLLDELWKVFESKAEVTALKLRLRETEISYAEVERSRTA
ncbi:MAG: 6-pyruvoyl tetrahydropterin synthase family protein [Bacteroidia bacterium]|nr:6-pyruvoyl tetrahydropterin synthase family protein [Bacteroidia bacterium]